MGNLNLSFLPARVRGVVYMVSMILGILVYALQSGFKSIGQGDPVWLTFASGFVAPLLVLSGTLALSNLPAKSSQAEVEIGNVDADSVNQTPFEEIEPADDPLETEPPEPDETDPGEQTNEDYLEEETPSN